MDKQFVFNKAVRGLAKQRFKRSTDSGNYCRYRSEDGLRCGIGHLIPNHAYSKDLEGMPVGWADVHRVLRKCPGFSAREHFTEAKVDFLQALQNAHDGARTPAQMRRGLRDVAELYDLKTPKVLA